MILINPEDEESQFIPDTNPEDFLNSGLEQNVPTLDFTSIFPPQFYARMFENEASKIRIG